MIPYDVIHHVFIIKRHFDHKKDLMCRYKSLNIVEKELQKFMPKLDTKTKREIPLQFSTLGVTIDEGDLTTFKIDITLIINEKTEEQIDQAIGVVIKELKQLNRPRTVMLWTERQKNNN